jgi:hypothetical protein
VQAGDGGRIYPTMRAQATPGIAQAPIALEGGTTDVTITVNGEAVLEAASMPAR